MLKYFLTAALLIAMPAYAKDTAKVPPGLDSATPVEIPAEDTAYVTFPLPGAQDEGLNGCLWRMPPLRGDGIEAYAVLSVMRADPQDRAGANLQLTGARVNDMGEMTGTRFGDLRLTAGKKIDTSKISSGVGEDNPGPTVKILLPRAEALPVIEALAADGGEIYFTDEAHKKHTHKLSKPTADEVTTIKACVEKLKK